MLFGRHVLMIPVVTKSLGSSRWSMASEHGCERRLEYLKTSTEAGMEEDQRMSRVENGICVTHEGCV